MLVNANAAPARCVRGRDLLGWETIAVKLLVICVERLIFIDFLVFKVLGHLVLHAPTEWRCANQTQRADTSRPAFDSDDKEYLVNFNVAESPRLVICRFRLLLFENVEVFFVLVPCRLWTTNGKLRTHLARQAPITCAKRYVPGFVFSGFCALAALFLGVLRLVFGWTRDASTRRQG